MVDSAHGDAFIAGEVVPLPGITVSVGGFTYQKRRVPSTAVGA